MATFSAVLLMLGFAIGVLLTFLGYGILFTLCFSRYQRISVIGLILLGFSGLLFVFLGYPAYYSLPLWLLPIVLVMFAYPTHPKKTWVLRALWVGIGLLLLTIGLFYGSIRQAI